MIVSEPIVFTKSISASEREDDVPLSLIESASFFFHPVPREISTVQRRRERSTESHVFSRMFVNRMWWQVFFKRSRSLSTCEAIAVYRNLTFIIDVSWYQENRVSSSLIRMTQTRASSTILPGSRSHLGSSSSMMEPDLLDPQVSGACHENMHNENPLACARARGWEFPHPAAAAALALQKKP